MKAPDSSFLNETEKVESIRFDVEDVRFDFFHSQDQLRDWIRAVIRQEGKHLCELQYVFCSDDYLFDLNQRYLQHDTLTDIITFPYAPPPQVWGDIFISIDRVKENASLFRSGFPAELHRVMIHGVLHLCGYGDKTAEESALMRQKENDALELLDIGY